MRECRADRLLSVRTEPIADFIPFSLGGLEAGDDGALSIEFEYER